MIRQPIVAILGHVDHGKTLLLDKIRGSAIAAKEAGGITQAIGASIIPLGTIRAICGQLLETLGLNITLPGLLFIDTPGHAAFVNLRKRGGNLADLAILVVDINEGFKPQTLESLEILKAYKTPFIIAVNKIDLVRGWKSSDKPLLQNLAGQSADVMKDCDTKLYAIVTKLFELGFEAERFDRISDYTKQIALVPTSAKTGEGIPELLMVLTGVSQRYLELKADSTGPAKGTVLEVKEEKGVGKVVDAIIYDGKLEVNDEVLIGGIHEPVLTRVKALFEPAPLAELREKRTKFVSVKHVHAATGVRVSAPNVDDVVAGMPLLVVPEGADVQALKESVQKEVSEVIVETEELGIIIKADSLGSLEALSHLLKEKGIPVRKASIGPITRKDLIDAEAIAERNPAFAAILAFNLPAPEGAPSRVKAFTQSVIYKLAEDYEEWVEQQKRSVELEQLEQLVKPCKIEILKGYVFRQSNPAIVGVDVLGGTVKTNTPLMNAQGKVLTTVKGIQLEQESIERAERGKQVAVSLPNVIVGRQINEGDILYSAVPENHFRKYKEFKEYLKDDEKAVLKEIANIMRKENPVWGV